MYGACTHGRQGKAAWLHVMQTLLCRPCHVIKRQDSLSGPQRIRRTSPRPGQAHGDLIAEVSTGVCIENEVWALTQLSLIVDLSVGVLRDDLVHVEGNVVWYGNAHPHNLWHSICGEVQDLQQ